MSSPAKPSPSAAVVAALQARHATALRSYALELWEGDVRRAEESLAATWREWSRRPPAGAEELPREAVFAALRREVIAAQRRSGAMNEEAGESAEERDERQESASARVARRFRQLTPKQQEVLRLRLRHGFQEEEIAHITEISAERVAQLLHHALGRLNGAPTEDARLTRLALSGAGAEETANETAADRARVAELRLTIEVARQVFTRGVDTFVPRKRSGARRRIWFGAAAVAVAGLVVAGVWWLGRPEGRGQGTATTAVTGKTRVAIPRAEPETPESAPRASSDGAPPLRSAGRREPARPSDRSVELSDRASPSRAQPAGAARADAAQLNGSVPTTAAAGAEPIARPQGAEGPGTTHELRAPSGGNAGAVSALTPTRPPAEEPIRPGKSGASAALRADAGVPRAEVEHGNSVERERGGAQSAAATTSAPELKADRLDTAPIAALRRALAASRWPSRREVPVRAMLARVPPSPSAPGADEAVLTTRVESSDSPWHPERKLVRVAVQARAAAPVTRAPATVILLLDVSGSMDAPNRLPLVQEAVAGLLRRLRPEDRVGVVTYAGESRVLLPPTAMTAEREIRAAVEQLEAKGRTNGGAGLREAFALAASDGRGHGEHVVILCTDGDFNMGETSEEELGALIDRHRESGVRLAIFGFGRADRIDARLEALAARAHGGSGYVNTRAEAEQALVVQLDELFAPVAEELEVWVEFDPARVARFRGAGEAEMRVAAPGVETPVATRERVLPGETVSALFEIEPAAGAAPSAADLQLRLVYRPIGRAEGVPYRAVSAARAGGGDFAQASVDFRFAAALAAFGEALQEGPEAMARLDEIERWARAALGEDAGGYRAEFLALMEQARRAARADR